MLDGEDDHVLIVEELSERVASPRGASGSTPAARGGTNNDEEPPPPPPEDDSVVDMDVDDRGVGVAQRHSGEERPGNIESECRSDASAKRARSSRRSDSGNKRVRRGDYGSSYYNRDSGWSRRDDYWQNSGWGRGTNWGSSSSSGWNRSSGWDRQSNWNRGSDWYGRWDEYRESADQSRSSTYKDWEEYRNSNTKSRVQSPRDKGPQCQSNRTVKKQDKKTNTLPDGRVQVLVREPNTQEYNVVRTTKSEYYSAKDRPKNPGHGKSVPSTSSHAKAAGGKDEDIDIFSKEGWPLPEAWCTEWEEVKDLLPDMYASMVADKTGLMYSGEPLEEHPPRDSRTMRVVHHSDTLKVRQELRRVNNGPTSSEWHVAALERNIIEVFDLIEQYGGNRYIKRHFDNVARGNAARDHSDLNAAIANPFVRDNNHLGVQNLSGIRARANPFIQDDNHLGVQNLSGTDRGASSPSGVEAPAEPAVALDGASPSNGSGDSSESAGGGDSSDEEAIVSGVAERRHDEDREVAIVSEACKKSGIVIPSGVNPLIITDAEEDSNVVLQAVDTINKIRIDNVGERLSYECFRSMSDITRYMNDTVHQYFNNGRLLPRHMLHLKKLIRVYPHLPRRCRYAIRYNRNRYQLDHILRALRSRAKKRRVLAKKLRARKRLNTKRAEEAAAANKSVDEMNFEYVRDAELSVSEGNDSEPHIGTQAYNGDEYRAEVAKCHEREARHDPRSVRIKEAEKRKKLQWLQLCAKDKAKPGISAPTRDSNFVEFLKRWRVDAVSNRLDSPADQLEYELAFSVNEYNNTGFRLARAQRRLKKCTTVAEKGMWVARIKEGHSQLIRHEEEQARLVNELLKLTGSQWRAQDGFVEILMRQGQVKLCLQAPEASLDDEVASSIAACLFKDKESEERWKNGMKNLATITRGNTPLSVDEISEIAKGKRAHRIAEEFDDGDDRTFLSPSKKKPELPILSSANSVPLGSGGNIEIGGDDGAADGGHATVHNSKEAADGEGCNGSPPVEVDMGRRGAVDPTPPDGTPNPVETPVVVAAAESSVSSASPVSSPRIPPRTTSFNTIVGGPRTSRSLAREQKRADEERKEKTRRAAQALKNKSKREAQKVARSQAANNTQHDVDGSMGDHEGAGGSISTQWDTKRDPQHRTGCPTKGESSAGPDDDCSGPCPDDEAELQRLTVFLEEIKLLERMQRTGKLLPEFVDKIATKEYCVAKIAELRRKILRAGGDESAPSGIEHLIANPHRVQSETRRCRGPEDHVRSTEDGRQDVKRNRRCKTARRAGTLADPGEADSDYNVVSRPPHLRRGKTPADVKLAWVKGVENKEKYGMRTRDPRPAGTPHRDETPPAVASNAAPAGGESDSHLSLPSEDKVASPRAACGKQPVILKPGPQHAPTSGGGLNSGLRSGPAPPCVGSKNASNETRDTPSTVTAVKNRQSRGEGVCANPTPTPGSSSSCSVSSSVPAGTAGGTTLRTNRPERLDRDFRLLQQNETGDNGLTGGTLVEEADHDNPDDTTLWDFHRVCCTGTKAVEFITAICRKHQDGGRYGSYRSGIHAVRTPSDMFPLMNGDEPFRARFHGILARNVACHWRDKDNLKYPICYGSIKYVADQNNSAFDEWGGAKDLRDVEEYYGSHLLVLGVPTKTGLEKWWSVPGSGSEEPAHVPLERSAKKIGATSIHLTNPATSKPYHFDLPGVIKFENNPAKGTSAKPRWDYPHGLFRPDAFTNVTCPLTGQTSRQGRFLHVYLINIQGSPIGGADEGAMGLTPWRGWKNPEGCPDLIFHGPGCMQRMKDAIRLASGGVLYRQLDSDPLPGIADKPSVPQGGGRAGVSGTTTSKPTTTTKERAGRAGTASKGSTATTRCNPATTAGVVPRGIKADRESLAIANKCDPIFADILSGRFQAAEREIARKNTPEWSPYKRLSEKEAKQLSKMIMLCAHPDKYKTTFGDTLSEADMRSGRVCWDFAEDKRKLWLNPPSSAPDLVRPRDAGRQWGGSTSSRDGGGTYREGGTRTRQDDWWSQQSRSSTSYRPTGRSNHSQYYFSK